MQALTQLREERTLHVFCSFPLPVIPLKAWKQTLWEPRKAPVWYVGDAFERDILFSFPFFLLRAYGNT
jgi:hypothetical protein